ncbi:hypothetical protein B0H17DRAFT_1035508 [Mycena rosella]|uniref:Hap4 transcription factor heteromerisation domain-containing protein n=1 Tax=Mycena rosella TaxID=1033263 RepID=A0AAD7M8T8_MYCRO|nr:hypothetical protein B0H17DRAFT_1035508 [Mycena rosella]
MASPAPQLWATASKEWVIQPKPKPGRKPKKDLAPVQQEEEQVDSKGRRVQNRAAQPSQLADLQARVQSYEQGEIERNVALQSIAKRLKEENEALRKENAILNDKLAKAEQERDIPPDNDRKRWRDDSPASSVASTQRKKYKVDHDLQDTQPPHFAHPYISSPQSMASSPDSNSSADTRFSSVPFDHPTDAFAAFSNLKSESAAFPPFDCGFCSEDTPCVCRDVFHQTAGLPEHKLNVTPIRSIALGTPPPEETSILDNLPPYQPPVPLRLRPRGTTQLNTIFQVSPPSQPSPAPANCSGDPSNCPACADDSFGKAFCEKISALLPCDNCPCASDSVSDVGPSQQMPTQHSLDISAPSPISPFAQPIAETIPTSDAWRRLKSHPNVAFTDLDMLADVVARRSKCTGPRIVLTPPPGDEYLDRPVAAGTNSEQPILLTDPHAHFREKERARASPPRLQEKCGRGRVREVQADAVRDALRLLDAKFLAQ